MSGPVAGATAVRPVVAWAERVLADAGVPSSGHDAHELAAFAIGCPRGSLLAAGHFSAAQHEVYRYLVQRRAARVPLQHLTGSAGFRHLDIAVGPGVFVPRPETEVVAGWCVEQLRGLPAPLVVDLCTGSAAIALSIAHEVPAARVHAVESEDAAVEWARRNIAAGAAGRRVTVHHADARGALADLDGTVDLVVANPPYLARADADLAARLDPEVRDHDPAAALWGGPDGLDGPRLVEAVAGRLLRPGGRVAVEHGEDQGAAVAALFAAAGLWGDVVVRRDLAGRERFVTARRAAESEAAG